MTTLNSTFHGQLFQAAIDHVLKLRLGAREIRIHKDFRNRFYQTNPWIECRPGVNAGHVEVLFLRHWLLVLSKAQH